MSIRHGLLFVNSQSSIPTLGPRRCNRWMLTATEIRKQRLEELISRYGSIAALNDALDLARTDATLSQIRNGSPHSKTGKARCAHGSCARSHAANEGGK